MSAYPSVEREEDEQEERRTSTSIGAVLTPGAAVAFLLAWAHVKGFLGIKTYIIALGLYVVLYLAYRYTPMFVHAWALASGGYHRKIPEAVAAGKDGVPLLIDILQNTKNAIICADVAEALRELGPVAAEAAEPLAQCYKRTNDVHASEQILLTIGTLGSAAKDAVPTLIDVLREERVFNTRDCQCRELLRWCIAEIGVEATPFLNEVLQGNQKKKVKTKAAEIIKRIDESGGTPSPPPSL